MEKMMLPRDIYCWHCLIFSQPFSLCMHIFYMDIQTDSQSVSLGAYVCFRFLPFLQVYRYFSTCLNAIVTFIIWSDTISIQFYFQCLVILRVWDILVTVLIECVPTISVIYLLLAISTWLTIIHNSHERCFCSKLRKIPSPKIICFLYLIFLMFLI